MFLLKYLGLTLLQRNKKEKTAVIRCRVCDANFGTPINDLFEPVDVYCKWIDACENANKEESSELPRAKGKGDAVGKRGSGYVEDEELEYDRNNKGRSGMSSQRSSQFVDEDEDEEDEDEDY